ncbi:MAG: FMN-binding protein [Oscillospiraceae bacterium]|nr:FMN-binding protein [Oscillospiraceae bacterium]
MKTESNVMYIIRLAAILLIITSLVAAALAGVNSITAPVIARLTAEKTQMAIEAVLPGGGEAIDFAPVDLVSKVYKGENGYAIEVTPGGFDNTITMMVGVDFEGKVLGIDIIKHTETAGLGAVADAETPAGQNFRGQFVGTSGSVAVTKDGGAMDSITGATITSRAICDGVNAALACVATLG